MIMYKYVYNWSVSFCSRVIHDLQFYSLDRLLDFYRLIYITPWNSIGMELNGLFMTVKLNFKSTQQIVSPDSCSGYLYRP